ncbi:MAG: hypothetical protein ACOX62_06700 [Christensenellales bacterium]|jgi:hypothetical protein
MTKETFEKETLRHLKTQRLRYPSMQRQDMVKFVFQAMLGVGHLLSSRDAVTDYIAREMDKVPADPEELLFEMLSPSWCRLNLRRAKADHIQPQAIAGLMLASRSPMQFTRMDVLEFCKRLAKLGLIHAPDEGMLNRILDESWLPSHSSVYRAQYRPAYRVISADLMKEVEL